MQYELTPAAISGLVGLALSAIFRFWPAARARWSAFDGESRRLIMAALCLTAGASISVIRCGGLLECVYGGWEPMLTAVLAAWAGSQIGYASWPSGKSSAE